jgi:hypothetical protein
MPIDPTIAQTIDAGKAESLKIEHLDNIIAAIEK